MKKILWGVSGIGNGHSNRQLSLITELAKDNKICILCYDESLRTFEKNFGQHPNVKLVRIAIPFIVGIPEGLDFGLSATNEANQDIDFLKIDCEALDTVAKEFGIPDLAITDYEPLCAQFAYSHNVPLVTIDQQSKYLFADLPKELGGFTFEDEVQRLHMFFPKAAARISCSFFRTKPRVGGDEVLFFPAPIKPNITNLVRRPAKKNIIQMYISSAREFVQTPSEIVELLAKQKDSTFNLFVKGDDLDQYRSKAENINLFPHGSPEFITGMSTCDGILTTAGHSLLSEAMYLGIPVYAMPVAPHEQHLNAKIIGDNKFGMNFPRLDSDALNEFVQNLEEYARNIREDKQVLIRGVGQDLIVDYLRKNFLSSKKILVFSPPFAGHLNLIKELIKETEKEHQYHVIITGWRNIDPDLSGLNENIVTRLDGGKLTETDPALWTFPRAASLMPEVLKLVDDFKPDLILYDFFSIEGYLAGRIKNIPYWSSIPALIGPNDKQDYCEGKLREKVNVMALERIKGEFGVDIKNGEVEMISDGFHLPGEQNIIWSFEEITPKNFGDGRSSEPYVFAGNLRGDNYEKTNYKNRKPLIYFSLGTVVMDNLWNQQAETREKLRKFVAELADLWKDKNYQVIFITQGKTVLEQYPENWWVYDHVDQVEVLSRADIFITHGGSNSFHEGIMQKVPMLLIPFFGDQLLVAKTAEELEVGIKVGGSGSIDTHANKDFIDKDLAVRLDNAVEEILLVDKYAVRYIDLQLSSTPISNLLRGEIPFQEGELILGDKVKIPRRKDELPVTVDGFLQLLEKDAEELPPGVVRDTAEALKFYTAGEKTVEDKSRKIVDYFRRISKVYFDKHDVVTEIKHPNRVDEVVLTSENELKKEALRIAIGEGAAIETIDPHLPFDEQLVGIHEIAWAAIARLKEVRKEVGNDKLIVSVVSGLVQIDQRFLDVAVAVSEDAHRVVRIAKSKGLAFPLSMVQKARLRGFKKFTVGSVIAEDEALHEVSYDPHKLLTKGKRTRLKILAETIEKVI